MAIITKSKNVAPALAKRLVKAFSYPVAQYGSEVVPWAVQRGLAKKRNKFEIDVRRIARTALQAMPTTFNESVYIDMNIGSF